MSEQSVSKETTKENKERKAEDKGPKKERKMWEGGMETKKGSGDGCGVREMNKTCKKQKQDKTKNMEEAILNLSTFDPNVDLYTF